MADNLEVNIVPPTTPGAPSTISLTGPGGLLIFLPLNVAGLLGSTLIQVAAFANERDRVGTHVEPAAAKPLIVI